MAGIFSPIGTAKLNDIDSETYLRHVLGRAAPARSLTYLRYEDLKISSCDTHKSWTR
jgi:hypothetical protein